MTVHVKIGDTSYCQYPRVLSDAVIEACNKRIPPSCSHHDPAQAQAFVDILRGYGFDARVVEGSCDQRDEPYYGENT